MITVTKSYQDRLWSPSFPMFLAVVAAIVGISVSAHATVIADGGFESAVGGAVYFAGQTIDGGSWNVTKGAVYIDSLDPYVFDGSNSVNLALANLYAPTWLDQALTTTMGQQYTVNFWADADSANTFSLTANGVLLTGSPLTIANNGFPGLVTNKSLFVDYAGRFVATSTTTDLRFADTGNPPIGSAFGSVMIDDVSIAATPEPGSIVLMLSGMAGLVLLVGKKRLGRSGFLR